MNEANASIQSHLSRAFFPRQPPGTARQAVVCSNHRVPWTAGRGPLQDSSSLWSAVQHSPSLNNHRLLLTAKTLGISRCLDVFVLLYQVQNPLQRPSSFHFCTVTNRHVVKQRGKIAQPRLAPIGDSWMKSTLKTVLTAGD
jgi:hypothetical protein